MAQKVKRYSSPLQATVVGISDLFKKQVRVGQLSADERLDGRKVLITGSSSGLGLAAAKQIAALGAEVIMAVRSGIPEKGEEVKKASGNPKVQQVYVNLADFDSVKNFVTQVKKLFDKIDILICNAAIVVREARKTRYGLDEMFTVNYLATFFLVNSLLKEKCLNTEGSALPRIIFVSSESHRNPLQFDWDTFGQFIPHKMAKTVERYGYYKLLLTTFSQELERRLNTDNRINYSVFSLCPGPINSKIAREAPAVVQPLLKLAFKVFFRSPEKAVEPVIYLAASKNMEGKARDYFFLMSRKEVDAKAADPENGKRLWKMTEELLSTYKIYD